MQPWYLSTIFYFISSDFNRKEWMNTRTSIKQKRLLLVQVHPFLSNISCTNWNQDCESQSTTIRPPPPCSTPRGLFCYPSYPILEKWCLKYGAFLFFNNWDQSEGTSGLLIFEETFLPALKGTVHHCYYRLYQFLAALVSRQTEKSLTTLLRVSDILIFYDNETNSQISSRREFIT